MTNYILSAYLVIVVFLYWFGYGSPYELGTPIDVSNTIILLMWFGLNILTVVVIGFGSVYLAGRFFFRMMQETRND